MHEVSHYCGPHIGHQFVVMGFISVSHFHMQKPHLCTVPMELKTLIPCMLLEMIIYLLFLMYGFSTVISIARKEGSGKRTLDLERGLCG